MALHIDNTFEQAIPKWKSSMNYHSIRTIISLYFSEKRAKSCSEMFHIGHHQCQANQHQLIYFSLFLLLSLHLHLYFYSPSWVFFFFFFVLTWPGLGEQKSHLKIRKLQLKVSDHSNLNFVPNYSHSKIIYPRLLWNLNNLRVHSKVIKSESNQYRF